VQYRRASLGFFGGYRMAALPTRERVILLVDDNQDDVLLIMRAFERTGLSHWILAVPTGMEALAYLKGEPPYINRENCPLPDLVLLDIKMPGMDGFEVLRWIRRQSEVAKTCVVMLTSSDQIRDVNQAYQLGANSFLVKPLDFENAAELWHSLETLLGKQSYQDAGKLISPTVKPRDTGQGVTATFGNWFKH
jgi:CheY-like chemotaxis protein